MSNSVKITLTIQEVEDLMGFMLELGLACSTLAKESQVPMQVRVGMLQRLERILSIISDMSEDTSFGMDAEMRATVSHVVSFESYSNLMELLTEVDLARDAIVKTTGFDLPNPRVGPMDRAYRARVVSKLQTAEKVN